MAVGQDIYTWGAYKLRDSQGWYHPNRGAVPDSASYTSTPAYYRYPYAASGRDSLRIVGANPLVAKSASPQAIGPGGTSTFTLKYRAEGTGVVPPTVDDYTLTDTLPTGMTYVPGSAVPAPSVTTVNGRQVLKWEFNGLATMTDHTLTYRATASSSLSIGTRLVNSVVAELSGQTSPKATATVVISDDGYTTIVKTADQAYIPNLAGDGVGEGSWTVTVRSFDPVAQAFTDTIDILPYNGDGRGTSMSVGGSYQLSGPIVAPGAAVYYTTTAPAQLSDDPAHASNGSAGAIAGNTVNWTTAFTAEATAVRVIGAQLAPNAARSFTIPIETAGVKGDDTLVNRAQGRAEHTQLVMRTSASTTIANYYSANLIKEVQNADGDWVNANDPVEYPRFRIGDEVTYRITISNTGQGTLKNLLITDDEFSAAGGFTVASLAPGQSQSHEFTITLDGTYGGAFVNTACASADTPSDSQVAPTINCDPAGIEVVNYSVRKVSDPISGSNVVPGDTITYTVDVAQEGSVPADAVFTDDLTDVLDDATFNADEAATIGSVAYAEPIISWNGTVGVGKTARITYSVTVIEAGDHQLKNVVTSPGCVTAGECRTSHDKGWFTFHKTSNPASGSTVTLGDSVKYTVTIEHHGIADLDGAVVNDDLARVLDAAKYNKDARVQSGPGAVDISGNSLRWVGDLKQAAPNNRVVITYSVTPHKGGDHRLDNTVQTPDPRGRCDQAVGCTTTHDVAWYTLEKASDPASGSTVTDGSTVTYTVSVTHHGVGAVPAASFKDDLSGVLDAARYNGDVSALAGSATVDTSTQLLTWSGDLRAGDVVTVSYSVEVKRGGDNRLDNVVTAGDPRGECIPGHCSTTHPNGWYVFEKKSDPASGEVKKGDTVTYTVTVTQKGPGAVTAATVTDDMSDVLDDARYNKDATASVGEVSFRQGKLTWTGDLAVDATATISYSVVVTGQGDERLRNVVATDDPRGTCSESRACVTSHGLPGQFSDSTDALPDAGSSMTKKSLWSGAMIALVGSLLVLAAQRRRRSM